LSLRRSPQLTPTSLAARRANALRSTGPRTAAGKARSCLNALRHGRRARDLRAMIARTGDSEALFLLDWFHHHILLFWRPRKERTWRYTIRLAARVWCFMNGLGLRPRAGETQEEADRKRACRTYRYGDARVCPERPQGLQIAYKRGPGVRFLNPTPTRRKHLLLGWLPEFRSAPGPPHRVKRVRRVGPESEDSYRATPRVDPRAGALRGDDIAGLDSRPSLSRGQALRGNDGMGGSSQELSHRLPGKLRPPIEGMAKNSVQTKLECGEESMACYDSHNRQVEIAIATPGAGPQGGFEGSGPDGGLNGQNLDGRAPPHSPCEVTFAEEELWMFMAADDHDWEACQASHALIELQWSKWRQAITELKSIKAPPTRGRRWCFDG
jgi:hypothetical protein